jgi:PTS system mannitol-specific IIC component
MLIFWVIAGVALLLLVLTVTVGDFLEGVVDWLVANSLLPIASIFIEPGKILFLNNAINHGVLTPLGVQQSEETGKSVLFLLEANPAAGLGLLLAYSMFGKGLAKASAPGAAIIHFFGGIHEVYFPYVLMKPKLILAMFAGGFTQILINVIDALRKNATGVPLFENVNFKVPR